MIYLIFGGTNMPFAIITDSASNLNEELLEKYDIDMLTFHYLLDDKSYPCFVKEEGYKAKGKEFYNKIRNGAFIKTSLISPQDYINCFKKYLSKGIDILYISLAAGVSGTYNSACNARDMLIEDYPNAEIKLLDSYNASFGEGLLAILASELRKQNKDLSETYNYLENYKFHIRSEFMVEDLIYLRRTGRISFLTYSIGKILDIKPLLYASRKGSIESFGKVRGKKKALMTILDSVIENIVNPEEQTIFISHCDNEEDAIKAKTYLSQNLKVKDIYIEVFDFCTGSHAGPGSIAIFYQGKERLS